MGAVADRNEKNLEGQYESCVHCCGDAWDNDSLRLGWST